MEEKINKKNKNTSDIIKEVAELYGFEITECEKGKGGFYAGDKKIEFSETDFWDGLNEDYFKSRRREENIIKSEQNKILLDSFKELKEGWNSYGAKVFSVDFINMVKEILNTLTIQPSIFPIGRGSIQFEYEKPNGAYLEFEIFDENDISAFMIDENKQEIESSIDSKDINNWVEQFYKRK